MCQSQISRSNDYLNTLLLLGTYQDLIFYPIMFGPIENNTLLGLSSSILWAVLLIVLILLAQVVTWDICWLNLKLSEKLRIKVEKKPEKVSHGRHCFTVVHRLIKTLIILSIMRVLISLCTTVSSYFCIVYWAMHTENRLPIVESTPYS